MKRPAFIVTVYLAVLFISFGYFANLKHADGQRALTVQQALTASVGWPAFIPLCLSAWAWSD